MPYQKETYFYQFVILFMTFLRYNIKRFDLKTNTIKYFIFFGILIFLIACSTKKNTFISRNSHALSTKDNILYNGGLALDKGVEEVKLQNQDNFWDILPIERMQISEQSMMPGQAKNANFERAETKATKAIQKHSMNIQGSEKNPQMDEAYLMLGKARYYDQRFVPALDAFNYVLNKSPKSDKIYEVKIWREKTNMRLDNDALAVNNLRKLLKEIKFKNRIFADANATLGQAFINLQEKDSAIAKLKIAKKASKSKEEISRYNFIIGQLYEQLGYKDKAYESYQTVIDMRRKAAKKYVIHAHARQASQFNYAKGDTTAFLQKFNDLILDRENRPFLDVLHHQKALFYEKQNNNTLASKEYNLSLKKKSQDTYLIASNYRNLADLHFIDSKFIKAGKYYDSTLVNLKPRTREYNLIKKKRENLDDVIKYEGIVQRNDSIISLFKMSSSERIAYFDTYILKLQKEDEAKQVVAEKNKILQENLERNDGAISSEGGKSSKKANTPIAIGGQSPGNDFYFYNPTTVAYGKKEFLKTWGKRPSQDNWRTVSIAAIAKSKNDISDSSKTDGSEKDSTDIKVVDDRLSADFYIKQIPESQTIIDSLSKEGNFAYYQLGVIYKEKFKEYQYAIKRFERLLNNNPEERLILPSMYNLFKLYEIVDKNKADAMKSAIISQYPDSRYAQILQNPGNKLEESNDSPSSIYQNIYKQYLNRDYKIVLTATENAIDRFTGDEIVPKLELLKASIIGKLKGLEEFSIALNYVALNYPNSEEGKRAENLLSVDMPKLQALQLSKSNIKNWKILYKSKDFEDAATKKLRDKINKFIVARELKKVIISLDIYTMTDNFVVIHGFNSEDLASGVATILKEYKDYKIIENPIVISSENYLIVQVKKNIDDYLAGNILENAAQPNWDGTLEKEDVSQQQKPVVNNNQQESQSKEQRSNKKGEEQSPEEQEFGLPPSPQMPTSGKKG